MHYVRRLYKTRINNCCCYLYHREFRFNRFCDTARQMKITQLRSQRLMNFKGFGITKFPKRANVFISTEEHATESRQLKVDPESTTCSTFFICFDI